jgi:hypothetical protein
MGRITNTFPTDPIAATRSFGELVRKCKRGPKKNIQTIKRIKYLLK